MGTEISKASLSRRLAAGVLDMMLMSMLAVFGFWGITAMLNEDGHYAIYYAACEKYMAEYDVPVLDEEGYNQLAPQEQETYEASVELANQALINDKEAMDAYYMLQQIPLIGISLGLLVAVLITEFAVPLLLKNGRTVGKMAFSIGVVRNDGVKANTMQLLVRALLGKYTVELMLPIFVWLMCGLGTVGIIVLAGLAILQIVVYVVSKTNGFIHDTFAGTVVVDLNTQRVFQSTDDLIAHVKRIQADRAARQDY